MSYTKKRNRGVLYLAFALLSVFLCSYTLSYAAIGINNQIPFQGTLKTSAGAAVTDGSYDIIFTIYDASSGGTTLWTGTHTTANGNAVTITDANFRVMLGSGAGNMLDLDFNDDTYYIGITIESDSEMTPRQRLGATGYAFNADTVDGLHATDFARSNATTSIATSSTDTLFTITQSGSGDILNIFDGGTEVFTVLDGGNVGIGTTTPNKKLDVQGQINLDSGDGYLNVVVGINSGDALTTGNKNAFFGQNTGATTTTGSGNLFAGSNAGLSNTTGTYNVFLGRQAGSANTTGINNVYVGRRAGSSATSSTGNVMIGYDVGKNETGSNKLYIGNNQTLALIYGEFDTELLTVNGSLTVTASSTFATTTVAGDVHISGALYDNADSAGINGYVLQSDGSGFDWVATSSLGISGGGGSSLFTDGGSATYLTSASDNLGIGTSTPNAKLTVQGLVNISDSSVGYQINGDTILYASSTNSSLAVGITAGAALLSDGFNNTAVGRQSLSVATSSDSNTAVGYRALYLTTLGANNTGVGRGALYSNTTGSSNTAQGRDALYSNTTGASNAAFGLSAAYTNANGTYNTAVGESALYSNSSGSFNTALGYQAGYDVVSALSNGYNTVLGYNTGRGITTGVENTIIGAQVTGLASGLSNNIILADGAGNVRLQVDSSGNVGIGTSTPISELHVRDATAAAILSIDSATGNEIRLDFLEAGITKGIIDYRADQATERMDFFVGSNASGDRVMVLEAGGNVGIGTTTPSYKLHVLGTDGVAASIRAEATGTDSDSFIVTDNVTSGWSFGIDGDNSDAFAISNAFGLSAPKLTILTGGNIGIGTTTPIRSLHLYKPANNSIFRIESTGDSNISGLEFYRESSAGAGKGAGGIMVTGDTSQSGARMDFVVTQNSALTSSPLVDMTILDSGNVGIGTTSPTNLLTLDSGNILVNFAGDKQFTSVRAGNEWSLQHKSDGRFTIADEGGAVMTFAETGDTVGIGTSSPAAKLHVTNTGSLASFMVEDQSEDSTPFVIDASGSVGIGTTTPDNLLTIRTGNGANSNDGITITNTTTGWGGSLTFAVKGTTQYNAGQMAVTNESDGGVMYLRTADTGSTLQNRMTINSEGNVGIGTTGPENLLHVKVNDAGITPHTSANFVIEDTGTNYLQMLTANTDTTGILFGDGDDIDVGRIAYDHSGDTMQFRAGAVVGLTVAGGGNIGIGTTGPSESLHVKGGGGVGATQLYVEGARGAYGTGISFMSERSDSPYTLTPQAKIVADGVDSWNTDAGTDSELSFWTVDNNVLGEKMVISNSGNVGIGDTAPTEATLVVGNAGAGDIYATFAAANSNTLCWDNSGASLITACTSLSKFKDNQVDLTLGLETLLKLQPREFDWNTSDKQHDLGFIAEEVADVDELLAQYTDGELTGVKYRHMTALIVNAVQEIWEMVTGNQDKIEILEERIEALEATLNIDPPKENNSGGSGGGGDSDDEEDANETDDMASSTEDGAEETASTTDDVADEEEVVDDTEELPSDSEVIEDPTSTEEDEPEGEVAGGPEPEEEEISEPEEEIVPEEDVSEEIPEE